MSVIDYAPHISESVTDLEVDRRSDYGAGRLFGVYTGIVTNNQDPENRARVKVRFPWLSSSDESWWARVSTYYAGKGRGNYWMPELDDEVLLVFEHGDFHHPYLVGSLWNGVDNVPGPGNPDGENNIKHIELRTGHKLIFDDTSGAEKITLIDCSGKNSIVIDVAADTITMQAKTGDINIQAPAGSVNMTCVDLKATVKNNASYSIANHLAVQCKDQQVSVTGKQAITAAGSMDFNCPMTTIQATKLQVNAPIVTATVVSSMTTTGAATMSGDRSSRQAGVETATIGVLQINAGEVGMEGQGAVTINAAATYDAKGKATVAEASGAASLTAGMVKADGSPGAVLVKGSVVTLS